MEKNISEAIGWTGMMLILAAYAAVSFGVLQASTLAYQAMNAAGAAGVAYVSLKKKAYQPGALNVIWAVIALIAVASLLL